MTLSRCAILLALVVSLACPTPAQAKRLSHLDLLRLNSSVRSVTSTYTSYQWANDKWTTLIGPNHRYDLFDREGNSSTAVLLVTSGRVWGPTGAELAVVRNLDFRDHEAIRYVDQDYSSKDVWKVDDQGRLIQYQFYGVYSGIPSLGRDQRFTYDSHGLLVSVTQWVDVGLAPNQ